MTTENAFLAQRKSEDLERIARDPRAQREQQNERDWGLKVDITLAALLAGIMLYGALGARESTPPTSSPKYEATRPYRFEQAPILENYK